MSVGNVDILAHVCVMCLNLCVWVFLVLCMFWLVCVGVCVAFPTSVKFPFKAVWSGRALSGCHRGQRFIRTAALHPPRRAQELKHMRKLNRHPNSLPYTKQFKWYSLERWQVLMSLSVLHRGRQRRRDSVRGWRAFFANCVPWALRRGAHQRTSI